MSTHTIHDDRKITAIEEAEAMLNDSQAPSEDTASGNDAANQPDPNEDTLEMQIPEEEKSRRLALLLERQRQIQIERNRKMIGRTVEVLVDGRHEARKQWNGRTSSNRVVNFTSPACDLLGQYTQVTISQAGPNSLGGEHTL